MWSDRRAVTEELGLAMARVLQMSWSLVAVDPSWIRWHKDIGASV